MHAGTRDQNCNKSGANWFSGNLRVAAAFADSSYD